MLTHENLEIWMFVNETRNVIKCLDMIRRNTWINHCEAYRDVNSCLISSFSCKEVESLSIRFAIWFIKMSSALLYEITEMLHHESQKIWMFVHETRNVITFFDMIRRNKRLNKGGPCWYARNDFGRSFRRRDNE